MADERDTGIPADVGAGTFKEALDKFRERVPIGADEYAKLSDVEKRKAFTIAEFTNARLVTDVYNALAASIERGTPFAEFQKTVPAELAAKWGSEAPQRLETLFRTEIQRAYANGRHELISAPAVREVRQYLRFDGVEDDRQSDICADLNGTVLPADDGYWKSHTPPLHPNCRSVVTPLSEEEAQAEGIEEEPPPLEPVAGFGVPPDEQGEDWKPNLDTIAPEIRDELAARLKATG